MTTLVIGDYPANMDEPEWLGYGAYFIDNDLVLVEATLMQIVLQGRSNNSTITILGSFDNSSEEALYASPVAGVTLRNGNGALLLDWLGLSISLSDLDHYITGAGGFDPEAFNIWLLAGDDTVTGGNADDLLRSAAGNDHLAGGGGGDTLRGEAGDDFLDGGTGNDQLDGGAGDDALNGGLGDDTFHVDSLGDIVMERADEGIDTVWASCASYSLAALPHVESLTYDGAADFTGMGNDLVNTLTGGSGNDTLYGGGGNDILNGGSGAGSDYLDGGIGADVMQGGDGNDIYVVDSDGDTVWDWGGVDTVLSSVSFNLAGTNADILFLTGMAPLNATGDARHNDLNGNDGNNILDSNGGNDFLRGGRGDDTYIVHDYGDSVIENPDEGIDSVQSGISFKLAAHVENLTLTGMADISANGNDLDNRLTGNSGNNALMGGLGADTLAGGLGDDSYYIDSEDIILENPGEGNDWVWCTTQISFSLADYPNVENLRQDNSGGAPITLTGNDADNWIIGGDVLVGGAGNDRLDGMGGNDTLIGGTGNDIFHVWWGNTLIENADEGTDTALTYTTYTLPEHVENLVISDAVYYGNVNGTGNELDNELTGNSGNNRLAGMAGNDTLDGGGGCDQATYAGRRASYLVTVMQNSYAVADTSGSDGTDTLTSIERLSFADSNVAFDMEGNAGQVYRLYKAAFARIPDLPGLGGWIGAMDAGSATLEQVANAFVESDEFRALYDSDAADPKYNPPSNEQFVKLLYLNALGRAPAASEAIGWSAQLSNESYTRAQVLTEFSESHENFVSVLYTLCNRDPNPTELATTVGQLYQGTLTRTQLLDEFNTTSPQVAGTLYTATEDQATTVTQGLILEGGSEADTLYGSAGRDRLTGLAGDDTLVGGLNVDTAVYVGNRAEYALTRTETGLQVTGPEGTDTLTGIERLQFADTILAFDTGGNAGQVYRLYQAAFERTPDTSGLTGWISEADKGMTLQKIAAAFISDGPSGDEFRDKYGNTPSNEEFVTLLYRNAMHREPDDNGRAYWISQLDNGLTRDMALIGFSESDENQASVIGVIQDGIQLLPVMFASAS